MRKGFVIAVTVLIFFIHSVVFAQREYATEINHDTAAADIIVDVFIIRPIGFVGLVSGTAVFILTLPAAVATKSVDRTKKVFVKVPYNYTFVRPLGDIRGEKF